MGTLKKEQISCARYSTLEELQRNIAEFIDEFYNRERLHSALDYLSPDEFEQNWRKSLPPAGLRFPRHEETCPDA
jgi:putative transposase